MSAKIQQCKECKRLFEPLYHSYICPACIEQMDKEFLIVKDYVYDHPDANVIKVSLDTGIPVKKILNMLREGRLKIADTSGMITCVECGKDISSGTYCNDCLDKIEQELQNSIKSNASIREKMKSAKGREGMMHSEYHNR